MITHTSPFFIFKMSILGVKTPLNPIKYGVNISSLFLTEIGANHHVLWGFY